MSTDNKLMFDTYLKFFPTIGKKIKLIKGGKVKVIDNNGEEKIYNNWIELNNEYKQLPELVEYEEKTLPNINTEKPNHMNNFLDQTILKGPDYSRFNSPNIRWYMFGDPVRYGELKKKFEELNRVNLPVDFEISRRDRVYYVDYNGNFIATTSEMVINLLSHSMEWREYKLPQPVHFTKAQIAQKIGMDINSFIID